MGRRIWWWNFFRRPACAGTGDEKKELCARFGVQEYWIGDAANRSMEILTLKDGRYELHCAAEEKGRLSSIVLTGLEFDLAEIQG